MHITHNPLADAERHADAEQARADHFESAETAEFVAVRDAVRTAFLAGDTAAIVPAASITGNRIHMMLTEVLGDRWYEVEKPLLQLIAAAMKGDAGQCARAAGEIVATVSVSHAMDVSERLELAGEVLA